MELVLNDENYNLVMKCPNCNRITSLVILGRHINEMNKMCDKCNVQREIASLNPMRQVLME